MRVSMTCACGATFEAECDGSDQTQRDKLERIAQMWGASHFTHIPVREPDERAP